MAGTLYETHNNNFIFQCGPLHRFRSPDCHEAALCRRCRFRQFRRGLSSVLGFATLLLAAISPRSR